MKAVFEIFSEDRVTGWGGQLFISVQLFQLLISPSNGVIRSLRSPALSHRTSVLLYSQQLWRISFESHVLIDVAMGMDWGCHGVFAILINAGVDEFSVEC